MIHCIFCGRRIFTKTIIHAHFVETSWGKVHDSCWHKTPYHARVVRLKALEKAKVDCAKGIDAVGLLKK